MLEPFLEPIDPDEDDSGMDEDRTGHHWHAVNHHLLVSSHIVHIHGIQPALGSGCTPEEESIDVGHILGRIDNDRSHYRPQQYINVVNDDESWTEYAPERSS